MNHPYVYEMQSRQKIEAMIAEGLRNQELKRQLQNTDRRSALQQPAEMEDSPLPRPGIAARLRDWVQRVTWSSPTGINIGS